MPDTAGSFAENSAQERRRFRRAPLAIAGRLFVPADGREATCIVTDMSPGGAALRSELVPDVDAQIVAYVDGFGRFEGTVVRHTGGVFGVRFHCSALKRERIVEQLTLFLNRTLVDETTLRRHDREPAQGMSRFTRGDGEIVPCEVMDLSLSGVSLKTDVKPPIGEFVLIGQMAGRVARHHEDGIGIEFVSVPQDKVPAERPALKIAAAR